MARKSIFNKEDILKIRKMYSKGATLKQVAAKYDCHFSTIYNVIRGIHCMGHGLPNIARKCGPRKISDIKEP